MDIVGLREVAERTGYSRSTVKHWVADGKIKPPDARLASGPVWDWPSLRVWLIEHGKIDEQGKPLQLRPPPRPALAAERRMRNAQQSQRQGRPAR